MESVVKLLNGYDLTSRIDVNLYGLDNLFQTRACVLLASRKGRCLASCYLWLMYRLRQQSPVNTEYLSTSRPMQTTRNYLCQQVISKWDVFVANPLSSNPTTTSVTLATIPNALTHVWNPSSLSIRNYVVRLTVTLVSLTLYFNLSAFTVLSYSYVSVIRSPLVIGVLGGPYFDQPFNSTLQLNAYNATYDTDIPDPTDKTGIQVQWFCKMQNETWPPTASMPVVLHQPYVVHGSGGCFGGGPGLVVNFTGIILTIDTSYFQPLVNYSLRLRVVTDVRNATYDLALYIDIPAAPVLHVK